MKFNFLFATCFFIIFLQHPVLAQNIVINEIMPSNSSAIADEDGDYSDWIELYNAGNQTVQLEGWTLSDSYSEPEKWIFPQYTLNPGEYLLLWASGKNRKPVAGELVNGLTREVYSNITGSSLEDLLQHPDYPDNPDISHILSGRFEAPLNIADNYGQRMHGLIKAPATGNYIFWVSSDDNGQLLISTDNTVENLHPVAEVPGWTQPGEWEKYPEQKSKPIYLVEGQHYYIMALMKEGGGGDNLAVRWQLPDGTDQAPVLANHLFTSGELPFHTNFSIDAEGEELILKNPAGETVDEIKPVKLPVDVSYGRAPDGSLNLLYFEQPTPENTNSSNGYSEIIAPPVFSHKGGFYDKSFELTLNAPEGTTILYSIDGTNPTPSSRAPQTYYYKNQYRQHPGSAAGPFLSKYFRSFAYTMPIRITTRSDEENRVSTISTTYDSNPWYLPSEPVEKAIVVKARAYKEGGLPSEVVTHTYFVNETGQNPYTFPVISLSAQEDELFSFNDGIYVAGQDFENWRTTNPNAEADGGSSANYHRRGDTWEYSAGFEYFDNVGERMLGQNVGFRIHGGWSRAAALKSLRIYSRKTYGESYLNYPIFKRQEDEAYKRIILRNSGNDYWNTYFRDAAIHEMVKHMHIETMAFEPSVLFLNGEYWGLMNVRERLDKHYLSRRFSIDENQIDLLEGNMWPVEGDNYHYKETMDYIRQHGLQENTRYDYVKTRLSIESYIDYMIAELFSTNTDWPGNNIKFWRYKADDYNPDAGAGKDGRWRWMLFDTDFGFGIYNPNAYTTNMLEFATDPNGPDWPNPEWSTFLFRKLLENESFLNEFITRYCDQLNSALLPEVIKSVINSMKQLYEPELENHLKRWRSTTDLSGWYNDINRMLDFADRRPEYVRNHLQEFFNLEPEYNLMVDVSDNNHGHVIVNTLPLRKETRGIDEIPYPWWGTYFKKLPLRLEAVPAKGCEFVRWESATSVSYEPVLEIIPEEDQHFVAVFEKQPKEDELIHYWNFNETGNLLSPTYTLLAAAIQPAVPSGGTSEITFDDGEGFSAENARFGDNAENHLRVNNPIGVTLTFSVPTNGFSKIKISYETRRSGQGAGKQIIEYSLNGTDFIKFSELNITDADPALVFLDFSAVEGADNNPDFTVRISFAQGSGGLAGNNRVDNFTVEGMPGDEVNLPPDVLKLPEDVVIIEGEDFTMNLNEIFSDLEGNSLEYVVTSRHPMVAAATVENQQVSFSVKQRGESLIELSASDGTTTSAKLKFKMLVYPKAISLAENNYSFKSWNPDAPEMTFPENMLFLQSNVSDPNLSNSLNFAYYVPVEEYHSDDAANPGYPYRNTRRTRLNGLNTEGISFINTGRDRDLGGALIAINTTGIDEVQVRWLAGTLLQNTRKYGLILQYRIGTEGNYTDIPGTGYTSASDGDIQMQGPFTLPQEMVNQEYIQLLWRYHFLSGTSGPRAQLRLDDIILAAKPSVPVITHPTAESMVSKDFTIRWTAADRAQMYELQLADNEDFSNPVTAEAAIAETFYLQNVVTEGKHYFMRVRALNEMIPGEWSDVVTIYSPVTAAGLTQSSIDKIQMFPNPFNESVKLQLHLGNPGKTDISLYDIAGRKIISIYQGYLPAGENSYTISGKELRAGTYILICHTESGIQRHKLIKK